MNWDKVLKKDLKVNKVVRKKIKLFFFSQLILGFFLLTFTQKTWAGPTEYQRCKSGNVCVIGEFLYDDEYNPIATASCTLTSRYPDGNVFLNSVAMSVETDGWYYYLVDTNGKPEGLYRSQMCCTVSPDYLCLDKSFYIGPSYMTASEAASAVWNAKTSTYSGEGTFGKNLQNPVLTAADIWSYTNRTLSSFGTLVADIWNYTSRTLTNFGTLIADIWGFGTRTLTSENLDSGKKLVTEEKLEEKVKQATESATASIKGQANKDLTQLSSEVATAVAKIDNLQISINQVLNKWGSYSASDIYDKVKDLSSQISAINTVPGTETITSLLNVNIEKTKEIMNKLLALEVVLDINRSLLEGLTNEPIVKTWIEEASIVFKTLAFNPSHLEKKRVEIKHYLPQEFKKEHLIKIDKELEIIFDPAEDRYYFYGEVELNPRQSKIFTVEVEDIWVISREEIESLRNQAKQLFEPLKNTSFYAQGAVLKSDIDAGLDRAWQIGLSAYTPEARIKAYREAAIELAAVRQKISDLKTLLAQAASNRSLLGFIGGVSATAVWAIVLIFIIGATILFYYLKQIRKDEKIKEPSPAVASSVKKHPFISNRLKPLLLFFLFFSGFFVGLLIAFNSQNQMLMAKKSVEKLRLTPYLSPSPKREVTFLLPSPSPTIDLPQVLGTTRSTQLNKEVLITVPLGSYLNLREQPDFKGKIIGRIKSSIKAQKIADVEGWKKISVFLPEEKKEVVGWVAAEFVKEE